MGVSSLETLDQILIDIDGTPNKTKMGANAILGISIACAKLLAKNQNLPLYSFLNPHHYLLPIPLINVFNGGSHANNNLDVQEFLLVPHGFSSFREALRASAEVFQTLKSRLKKEGYSVAVGDEGGVAPSLKSNEQAIQFLIQSIEDTGYQPKTHISLALDVAASSFYKEGVYLWENQKIKGKDLISIYDTWIQKYPIISIEDGLEEDQWEDWATWTRLQGDRIQIVGDDLFVTNKDRLQKGIEKKVANALLVKTNQIGTVTEAHQAVKTAHKNQYTCVLSHRSGETEDTLIADLSLAFGCEQIKTGGVCRGERVAKYNQLLRIEEEFGRHAQYQTWKKHL